MRLLPSRKPQLGKYNQVNTHLYQHQEHKNDLPVPTNVIFNVKSPLRLKKLN